MIIKCPYCSCLESKVVESRCTDDGLKVRRRRECESCHRRFTTYEVIESVPIMVIKRNGMREKFERKKIFEGLFKSCEKRKIPLDDIEKMTDSIEKKVQGLMDREVSSAYIGELCMEELRKVDEVAYIRFASVYREFKDVQELMNELKTFLKK